MQAIMSDQRAPYPDPLFLLLMRHIDGPGNESWATPPMPMIKQSRTNPRQQEGAIYFKVGFGRDHGVGTIMGAASWPR
jgi:hypothetical protein